jgi:Mrp family chromosome partitioning ATPase
MLASQTQRSGKRTAVLDADITGPSMPSVFGVHERALANEEGMIYPAVTKTGIQMVSLNMLLENDTDPVVWRGPVIAGVVKQFWTDVIWEDVDCMYVDMPPGTGDVPLTVFQSLPVDGIVVVTSPQEMVGKIVAKAVKMANLMKIPVYGIVENMSYFKCPDCGKEHRIFGESHIDEIAARHGIDTVCKLPFNMELAAQVDEGKIEQMTETALDPIAALLREML